MDDHVWHRLQAYGDPGDWHDDGTNLHDAMDQRRDESLRVKSLDCDGRMTTAPVIRESVAEDLPRIVEMFAQFVSSTQYAKYVGNDPTHAAMMMERLISDEDKALFVVDSEDGVVGMLGVMVFTQPFSGERIASELFWWLDPAHRGNGVWLLRRSENWARAKGARRMSMMAPIDKPRVGEIYAAVGYTEVERVFQKDL